MYKIKKIDTEEIKKNSSKLKLFLKEGYKIGFPNLEITKEVIDEKFTSLLTYSKDKNILVLGSFKDDKLVGYLWAFYRKITFKEVGHLNQIFIENSHRGQGLAQKMIFKMENFMIENNVEEIDLNATYSVKNAVRLYEMLEYKIERVVMIKKLRK
ncbi:GNAT family N-acetyltransferase [Psychrilyobacter atlanticus]|uniref:GNAT family N-acetyltransferase n=1 Tax=Psychrilyobacter atlanticus TaxID=271091 RepID=UPI000401D1C7|nr:GNAT family N-acetyltransferase [Psychrilyobacter atlanticus]